MGPGTPRNSATGTLLRRILYYLELWIVTQSHLSNTRCTLQFQTYLESQFARLVVASVVEVISCAASRRSSAALPAGENFIPHVLCHIFSYSTPKECIPLCWWKRENFEARDQVARQAAPSRNLPGEGPCHHETCRPNRQVIRHHWTCRGASSLSAIAVAGVVVDLQYPEQPGSQLNTVSHLYSCCSTTG